MALATFVRLITFGIVKLDPMPAPPVVPVGPTPAPVNPVPVPPAPVVPADPALRIIGTVIDTMIESKLTGAFVDSVLLRFKTLVNLAYPHIKDVLSAVLNGGQVVDVKSFLSTVITTLEGVVVTEFPALAPLVPMVDTIIKGLLDKVLPAATAKLAAKNLMAVNEKPLAA